MKSIYKKIFKRFINGEYLKKSELLRLNSLKRYEITKTKLFGKYFKIVDACTFLSSYQEIFKENIYKFNSNDKNITIFDCGANIGLATLYFKKIYPDSKIISFEPDPNIFKVLRENVISQGLDKVILNNSAVSYEDSDVLFLQEGGHSGMIVESQLKNNKIVKVRSVRLKNILKEFDEITFLKLDIEGYERYVIPDIADDLVKVKFLFIEYHSFLNVDQSLDEILSILKKANFRYYIKESYNKPFPFIDREIFLNMDLIINIFCYKDK